MNEDRNKFLAQQMRSCYHNLKLVDKYIYSDSFDPWFPPELNFSTWSGFGVLWNWVIQQKWWPCFIILFDIKFDIMYNSDSSIIQPDRFADSLYDYLTKNEKVLI